MQFIVIQQNKNVARVDIAWRLDNICIEWRLSCCRVSAIHSRLLYQSIFMCKCHHIDSGITLAVDIQRDITALLVGVYQVTNTFYEFNWAELPETSFLYNQ